MKWLKLTVTRTLTDPAQEIKRSLPIVGLGHFSLDVAKRQATIFADALLATYANSYPGSTTTVKYEILEVAK